LTGRDGVPTRGERNNNPGNIWRDMTPWLGLQARDPAVEARFCVFDSALHGIRALCIVLLNYQRLDGLKTLAQVITRWAPPAENDTGSYVTDVERHAGIGRSDPLNLEHPEALQKVAKAIIQHENGRCVYGDDLIAHAVRLALAH